MSWMWRRVKKSVRLAGVVACLVVSSLAVASEYHGQVTFNGLPVPGVTVTATQGSKTVVAVSDDNGNYSFSDLPDGAWKIELTMTGFATLDQNVTVAPDTPGIKWELKMLPIDQILAQSKAVKVAPEPVVAAEAPKVPAKGEAAAKPAETAGPPKPEEPKESSDGFLVNGSVNNAATSQFSLSPAFGNTRSGSKGLYNGGLSLILDNSALNARPYSLTGQELPQSSYNRVTAAVSFGGPIKIPHLVRRGPNFFIGYQFTRDADDEAVSGLVPTAAQRCLDPAVPCPVTINPQAQVLLALYPLPNIAGNLQYNYQVPVVSNNHQDAIQARLDRGNGRRDYLYGNIASQSTRADNSNLFGFRDTTDTLGLNAAINWNHRMNHNIYLNTGFRFSRLRNQVTPFFQNKINVSGAAGITGNDQDPANWGPPSLTFSSGITGLSDVNSAYNRNETNAVSESAQYYRGRHNVTAGGDFRRQEYNYFAQQNPRGSFGATPVLATNISDFADFLAGIPDTSSVAFGNADKYLRQSVYDAFVTDDWRIRPELTIQVGVRWEYGAPITETKDRLVNLDVAPNFAAVSPVLASSPHGPLTGQTYPNSLLRPDRFGIEPRIGISWRPIPGSSVVVRAGYGVYDDTSVYRTTALGLAQQNPLSTSLSVQNSPTCPLTLANGFTPCAGITENTFAVDPNFRVGYAQTWQLAVQRDLPAALQMTATYLGIKGTRGMQQFLPNTYPRGGTDPCPSCPTGFTYETSNGNSTRESGSLQLRRRLRSGFTATLQYTYSKSIDNDALLGGQGPIAGGATSQTPGTALVAQDWLNLRGERGLSTFDQRHLVNANLQYTSGMGVGGGTLMAGWRGRAMKEWTMVATIVAGSGLPQTPVYLDTVNGTGKIGTVRPNRTSAPLYTGSGGHFLNADAFTAPAYGQWGNAARDSIIGPDTFTFNASASRTFHVGKRFNLDIRVDSTNVLNHPVFPSYNTALITCTLLADGSADLRDRGNEAGAEPAAELNLADRYARAGCRDAQPADDSEVEVLMRLLLTTSLLLTAAAQALRRSRPEQNSGTGGSVHASGALATGR